MASKLANHKLAFAAAALLGSTILAPQALAAGPDSDGDGLSDEYERDVFNSDPNNPDSDGDGLSDGGEKAHRTDPNKRDTDDDGTGDKEDNCRTTPNRSQRDLDGDGFGDACDGPYSLIPDGSPSQPDPNPGPGPSPEPLPIPNELPAIPLDEAAFRQIATDNAMATDGFVIGTRAPRGYRTLIVTAHEAGTGAQVGLDIASNGSSGPGTLGGINVQLVSAGPTGPVTEQVDAVWSYNPLRQEATLNPVGAYGRTGALIISVDIDGYEDNSALRQASIDCPAQASAFYNFLKPAVTQADALDAIPFITTYN